MRSLVIHTGGIGDFILSWPALARLAEHGPVELMGRRDRLMLAVAAGLAEDAHELEMPDIEWLYGAGEIDNPPLQLVQRLSRFDRCVLWQRDGGGICQRLRKCGIPDVSAYPGLPPKDWIRHASSYYLERLGLGPVEPLQVDFPTERAPNGPDLDVVIHPGSGSAAKNWPLERFCRLAETLEKSGRSVSWCLGPAEDEIAVPAGAAVLREKELVTIASRLSSAALYTGNDSGITHLAAAAGCPSIAIFGPTNPAVWAPLGGHVQVVHNPAWPKVDEVLSLVPGLRYFRD